MLCGRFGGTVGWETPPELAVSVRLGVPSLGGGGGNEGLQVGACKPPALAVGLEGDKPLAQLLAQPHGAEVPSGCPPCPAAMWGGSLPTLGLCWAEPRLAGTWWGSGMHKRVPPSRLWGCGTGGP